MGDITTISWFTFFICIVVLLLLWWFSTRTMIGSKILFHETPWNKSQWARFLLVIAITLFILVNPVFHILTFGIFAILYYVFVSSNFLTRNLRKLGSVEKITTGLPFIGTTNEKLILSCNYKKSDNILDSKKALDKCLFSFPMIINDYTPKIQQLGEELELVLELTSDDYLSSLIDSISKAGFNVQTKNKS